MNPSSLIPKTPGQWLKVAMIPGLSVALLVVLWQPRQSETPVVIMPAGGQPAATATAATGAASSKQPQAFQPQWPKMRLEDVIAFNPFEPKAADALSGSSPGQAGEGSTGVVRGAGKGPARLVSTVQLQAIFVDAQGAAAMLDSEVVRVGDTLPSGGRVVEITAEGLRVEGQ